MNDAERALAGLHLSMIEGALMGAVGLLDRLHVLAACAEMYGAYPAIRGDIEELMNDVTDVVEKIKGLR